MALPNGNAARIRKILVQFQQDMITPTAQEIAIALGLPTRAVSNALSAMHDIHRYRKNNANVTLYSLTPFAVKTVKRKSASVTPPHYHNWQTPELTIDSYNLYEGRNLAMLAR